MITQQELEEWDGADETPFWRAIQQLTEEEKERLAKLSSESIRDAAQLILDELKRERSK
jgi:Mg2+ and Co2+ transporter CorA